MVMKTIELLLRVALRLIERKRRKKNLTGAEIVITERSRQDVRKALEWFK